MTDTLGVDARTVLRRVVPGYEPTAIEAPPQGNHKRTIVARYDDRPAVVVQVTDDPETAHTEATLLSAIRDRTDVPVPRLCSRGSLGGRGYLVTEFVPGADGHERFPDCDGETRRALARAFGRLLATLHASFRFDAAGPLALDETGTLTPTGPSVDEFARQYARDGLAALPSAFDDRRDAIEDALATRPTTTRPARLFPWDLRPGNALLADDGTLAAVLDWGDPLAAHPALSVAKTEHLVANWYVDDPASLRAAFRAGYESVRPLPDVPVADRLTAVVQSAVDSEGVVTRPRYPELTGDDAVAVHREWLEEWL